jgi:hypothetical protein
MEPKVQVAQDNLEVLGWCSPTVVTSGINLATQELETILVFVKMPKKWLVSISIKGGIRWYHKATDPDHCLF